VYIDECDYRLGRIGYGNKYGASRSEENQYVVESRKITNAKYAAWRDQAHRKFCLDEGKALKNALANFVPYSAKELLEASALPYKEVLSSKFYGVTTEYKEEVNKIFDHTLLTKELVHLVDMGVTFVTPEFQQYAQEVVNKYRVAVAARENKHPSYFINVRMVGDVQWVDIAECDAPRTDGINNSSFHKPVQSMLADDVPEDIKAKVATLMMVDARQYVQGVGMRTTTKTFWVER
jgi:hypothetical protein